MGEGSVSLIHFVKSVCMALGHSGTLSSPKPFEKCYVFHDNLVFLTRQDLGVRRVNMTAWCVPRRC